MEDNYIKLKDAAPGSIVKITYWDPDAKKDDIEMTVSSKFLVLAGKNSKHQDCTRCASFLDGKIYAFSDEEEVYKIGE